MSEAETQTLSVLLPDSSVAVHSRHKDTLEAVRALADDWRFARVKIHTVEGDAKAAGAHYKSNPAPDLVIVQTDTIDPTFTAELGELAGNCDETTAAIVIGPVNDVNLYRRLIDMGVSDYLVHPVSTATFGDVIARTLIERKGATGSMLIGFIGAKGGVGVSVLATACAWGAADILNQKTVLIDAAGGWSTLGVNVGFEPSATLSSAARASAAHDEDSVKRMLYKASDKLSVLATGSDAMLGVAVSDNQVESIIDMLMVKFPVMIVDLSQATPDIVRTVVGRANQVIVVSTPILSSLRLARSLVHEIKDLRGKDLKNIEMVINMHGLAPANEVPKKDIEQALEFKVSAVVPFAAKVFLGAENESRKLMADKDGMLIFKAALQPLLERVLELRAPDQDIDNKGKNGFLSNLLGSIKARK